MLQVDAGFYYPSWEIALENIPNIPSDTIDIVEVLAKIHFIQHRETKHAQSLSSYKIDILMTRIEELRLISPIERSKMKQDLQKSLKRFQTVEIKFNEDGSNEINPADLIILIANQILATDLSVTDPTTKELESLFNQIKALTFLEITNSDSQDEKIGQHGDLKIIQSIKNNLVDAILTNKIKVEQFFPAENVAQATILLQKLANIIAKQEKLKKDMEWAIEVLDRMINRQVLSLNINDEEIVEKVTAIGKKFNQNTLLIAAKLGIYDIFKLVCNVESIPLEFHSKELSDVSKLASYARNEFNESDPQELSEIFDALIYWFPEQALKMPKSQIFPTANSLTRICSSPWLKRPDEVAAYVTEGLRFKKAVYSNPSRFLTDIRAKLIELTVQRGGLANPDTFDCYLNACRYKESFICGANARHNKITSCLYVQSKEVILLHQAGISAEEILNGLKEGNQIERLIDKSKSFRQSKLASSFPESLQERIQEATKKHSECVIS